MSLRHGPDPADAVPPELEEVAQRLRAEFRREEIEPEFNNRLRAEITAESDRLIATAGEQSARRSSLRGILTRRRWRLQLALSSAAVSIAVIAALVTGLVNQGPQLSPTAVAISASFAGQVSVEPRAPLRIHFSVAVDQSSVVSALQLVPAATLTTRWEGNDLVLSTPDGLAGNTAYSLNIDTSRARDAGGAPLAGALRLFFGTSAVGAAPRAPAPPAALKTVGVIAAADGSEAVIASDGSLIATAGRQGSASSMLRLSAAGTLRLAAATSAICVSQTGRSLAYLEGSGVGTKIVMAAGNGSGGRTVAVAVDPGSPLGWIGDGEVSFVGAGRLRAIDRNGTVRVLDGRPIDATQDTIDIAPGGRYVFLRLGSTKRPGDGLLLDLQTHATATLRGIVGDPSFSTDGATVAWLDASGGASQLDIAPSAGGVRREITLPVGAGDAVSGLSLSPDGSRLLYSVTHPDGRSETRLSRPRDGVTEGVTTGAGDSPNWAPTSDRVAVLEHTGAGPQIALIDTPLSRVQGDEVAANTALTFADAQIAGDVGALQILAPGVDASRLARATRAGVLSVTRNAGGIDVAVRLVVDGDATHPITRVAVERVRLAAAPGSATLTVLAADAAPLQDLAPGPHVTGIRLEIQQGAIEIGVDSALDPTSVAGAITFTDAAGNRLDAGVNYDPAGHRLVVTTPPGTTGPVVLTATTSLRDIDGRSLQAPVSLPLSLPAAGD